MQIQTEVLKTKARKTKVNIVTLGCSKNLVDSEVLLTQLKGNKIDATHENQNDDANIIIIKRWLLCFISWPVHKMDVPIILYIGT